MKIFQAFILLIFISACKHNVKVTVQHITLSDVRNDSTQLPPPPPQIPTGLQVSAHLIYKDKSESTFDILKDKKIMLRNTPGGGGDVSKASNSIMVDIDGALDSMRLEIRNGRKTEIDERLSGNVRLGYVIKHTGCKLVIVTVSKKRVVLYNDTIPFHCGE